MNILETRFDSVFVLEYLSFKDNRGEFVKTIHEERFKEFGLDPYFAESYYSISAKDVLRGMHFQVPPFDHNKLVYVVKGSILDVVLDLRQRSCTFGEYFAIELNERNRRGLYIGKGFAHGFLSLEDNTIVEYHTSTIQSKEHEDGVHFNSFGFEWPVNCPIISNRDERFEFFEHGYKTLFK